MNQLAQQPASTVQTETAYTLENGLGTIARWSPMSPLFDGHTRWGGGE